MINFILNNIFNSCKLFLKIWKWKMSRFFTIFKFSQQSNYSNKKCKFKKNCSSIVVVNIDQHTFAFNKLFQLYFDIPNNK